MVVAMATDTGHSNSRNPHTTKLQSSDVIHASADIATDNSNLGHDTQPSIFLHVFMREFNRGLRYVPLMPD